MRKVEYDYLKAENSYEGTAYFLSGYFVGYDLLSSLNKAGQDGWEVAFRQNTNVIVMQRIIEEEE